MGIDIPTESDSDLSSDDESSCSNDSELPGLDVLLKVLEAGKYNWFEVLDYIEKKTSCGSDSPSLISHLNDMFSYSLSNSESKQLLEQSYKASLGK